MHKNTHPPLLTIAVPTFNRHKYLLTLIPELIKQIEQQPPGLVELLVIDNASTDGTQEFLRKENLEFYRYQRNSENIGADRNFLECIRSSFGDYVWLFGDDEELKPGGVHRVLIELKNNPGLLIAESDHCQTTRHSTYRDLLESLKEINPIFPVHHTLITRNIFPRSSFDLVYADTMVQTNYGHMYGLLSHLKNTHDIIVLSKDDAAFCVRELRAEFADPPVNLEGKLIELNRQIADILNYPRLAVDIWLYFRAQPLYRLRKSRKLKSFLKFIFSISTIYKK